MDTKRNKNVDLYASAALVLNNIKPKEVAKALIEGHQKEPFYLFNMDEVYRRIQHFKNCMPRVQMFYAMKANDCDMMLKLAIALGLGFDCASPGEIDKLRKLNVSPRSIIYAVTHKTPEQMMYARASGVLHTTFDASYELKKIKQYWPEARLLLRIRVDSTCKYRLGDKFGCDFETEAIGLLEQAASIGLRVIGVAFHVGSACWSPESYVVGLQHAKQLFDHEARAGRKMTIVDLGGGFISDRTDRINHVSKLINNTLDKLFPDPEVQITAEPGRYLCDSAGDFYCNICNIRTVRKDGKIVNMIYINDGIYGSLRFFEDWHTVKKFKTSEDIDTTALEETILWGPSCDSTDRVMKERSIKLPKCSPLDWLVFNIQGAYSFCFSSKFSCLSLPSIRNVISSDLWKKIKGAPVFTPRDFIINPDISTPLPSSLPKVLPNNGTYQHEQSTLLI